MCGIFGYYDRNRDVISDAALSAMGDVLTHRGPDGVGCHHYYEGGLALGNRRLAILDVENGDQPFHSDDSSITVVQNGEIFNHIELSRELSDDGFPCRTKCDTEVILRLYERDGIAGLHLLNGMFAIALYDRNLDSLFLVRDRIGEKPLYYARNGDTLFFASEIKSILNATNIRKPSLDAINRYLAFNYVPPPLTMFEGVFHVMPGTYLKIGRKGTETVRWFDLADVVEEERLDAEWIDAFNAVLSEAVRIRLRSDVPFGAFLSGGVDSSSVVGFMSRHLDEPVNTFCIGFDDPKYDESPYAESAAVLFGTSHTMEKVAPNMTSLWPEATYHCDQPHGDVSFLPTLRVSRLAAEKVKMVLTGDGADELFAGYDKYKDIFAGDAESLSDSEFKDRHLEKISLFNHDARIELFSSQVRKELGEVCVSVVLEPLFNKAKSMDRINKVLYIDAMLLLPGNNLIKPDRMGMAASIENRAPFLDHHMLTLAFSMPGRLKLHNGITKYLYKKAVAPLIGDELAYRQKQMFTVPIGDWFKTDLLPMCEDLLLSNRSQERKLFDYGYIRRLLDSHVNNISNNTREIRSLMSLELWFREFIDQD